MLFLIGTPIIKEMKTLRSLLFVLMVCSCAVYSASAQTSTTDTNRLSHPPSTYAGRLPGFVSHGKDDGRQLIMHCDGRVKIKRVDQPEIVLDGKTISYRKLQKVNVNNIQTVSILKDSASVAKYNRKGRRNGVLIVTTRKSAVKPTS